MIGLTGGREGDDARDPRRPAAGGCGFGGGGCEPAPAPVAGVSPVVMVRPGMTRSDVLIRNRLQF